MRFSGLSPRSVIYSILLHIVALGLLMVSVGNAPYTARRPVQNIDIVKAVTVDNKQVESELQKLKDIDREKRKKQQKKQQQREKKLKDLQKKAAKAEKKRKREEKKLADIKRKKVQEKKKREQEQKKIAQLKTREQELERKRKLEEEKRHKKELAQKRKVEQERRRQQAEQALNKQLAEEKRLRDETQRQQDRQLLQDIVANIYNRVVNNFNKSGLPQGLECVLIVRLVPGGDVVNVSVSKSSGNDIFDRRAQVAIEKASPLPVPDDLATFERLKLRQFKFLFKPED
ncbi:MAG: cell envelope integrity protein TolA [Gammaproteobacteria bacterium]